ncbi:MAG TPA: SRPBCC domain-containing protein [Thermoanaerobaculia bacterium]|nr:SRPBCC domain-containing protein [Thermoanaerobaculia bacterium]
MTSSPPSPQHPCRPAAPVTSAGFSQAPSSRGHHPARTLTSRRLRARRRDGRDARDGRRGAAAPAAVWGLVLAGILSNIGAAGAGAQTTPPAVERSSHGHVDVTVTRAPEKRLDFEVIVPATLDQVWQAFTTVDGLITWLTPAAKVELRLGGAWEAGFPGAKPGGGTILSFLPGEMLALAAMAPEAFPTVRRERTQAVFHFAAVDAAHTRVRLAQIGWQTGEEWDRAFAYLAKGNAELLESLHHRFASGPIDWQALLAASPPAHH